MDMVQYIRDIPDFPKPGILFKDITPLLADAGAMDAAMTALVAPFESENIEIVVGVESRGFLFGALAAQRLHAGFVPVRKAGKLPAEVVSETYDLEYGTDTVEIHADAIRPGQKVLMVDDLLATGGTMNAACRLVEKLGGEIAGIAFVLELSALGGRGKLGGRDMHVLIQA